METLNERIKSLRKEKGWTQLQLAEKLHVTDKAVSKWEVGEANPDLTLIISMAALFNVSIDYLVTGKIEEEKISLDDMDSQKRAEYLIKKDDVDNFKKYGYVNPNIVMHDYYSYGRYSSTNQEKLLELIYECNSTKIFKALIESSLSKYGKVEKRPDTPSGFYAGLINGDLDKFIKMCCSISCVKALDFIDLKFYLIGEKTDIKPSPFHIRESGSPADQDYSTITLSRSTLDFALNSKTSSGSVIDYFCDVEFFGERSRRVYFMVDDVIDCLYANADEARIIKLLDSLKANNEYAAGIYNESLYGSWYTGKRISGNAIYFLNNSHGDASYLRAYVYPIKRALSSALGKKDYRWINEFNDYNARLNELIPELKLHVYTKHEMKVMKVEFDPKSSKEEIWDEKYLSTGILNAKAFLNSEISIPSNDLDALKSTKEFIKSEILSYLLRRPIHKYEQIMKLLAANDTKAIFKLAIDSCDSKLEEAILAGDKKAVQEVAESYLPFNGIGEELKNADVSSLSFFDEYKKECIKPFLNKADEYIELITKDKKYRSELERVSKEIPFDYLRSELAKGNIDTVVIKLCVRLEAILKFGYRYEGDLFEMVDQYVRSHFVIKELHNCWDDEDNNYRYYQEEDERITQENKEVEIKTQVLHKLRMKRNSLVHADKNNNEITVSEIELCISIAEAM